MFCPNCGKETPDQAQFCMNCGFPISKFKNEQAANAAAKMTAGQPEAPAAAPETVPGETKGNGMPEMPKASKGQPEAPKEAYGQVPPEMPKATPVQPEVNKEAAAADTENPLPKATAEEPEKPISKSEGFRKPSGGFDRPGKPEKKSPLPVIIGAAAVLLAIILVLFNMLKPKYEVNDASLAPVTPIAGYEAASSDALSLSFLYPSGAAIRDNGNEGIYVYPAGTQGLPYIQVSKVKGKQDPDKYFKEYRKQTDKEYGSAEYENVKMIPVSKKTLYMQRASVFRDGADQIIDRYIEIYPSETVIYTIKSLAASSEDSALAAVIESLRPGKEIYGGSMFAEAGTEASPGGDPAPAPTETAPAEPTPTEPVPTQPAPTEPAPTQPAPTQPAPTQPAPTQPAPTQPAPTQPAPTQPAPTQPAPSGSSAGGRLTGQAVPGMDGYEFFSSANAGFAIMCNTSLVDSVWDQNGGMHVRLKALADDDSCDIVIQRNDFRSEGISTKEDFLQAYIADMVAEGAAAPPIYEMGGGVLQFKGITETYTEEDMQFAMYLFAADDGNGNIYTIYFDCLPEEADYYSEVVNGLFATLTPM